MFKRFICTTGLLVVLGLNASHVTASEKGEQISLNDTMLALDHQVFDAFNRCEDSGQLEKHKSYFDANVEFYHDNGGVTWDREAMIQNTQKYVCGNFTRELIEGTFSAYPINGFGAITRGSHRFCQIQSNQCDGRADFLMIWRQRDDEWQITRTVSYGHRAND